MIPWKPTVTQCSLQNCRTGWSRLGRARHKPEALRVAFVVWGPYPAVLRESLRAGLGEPWGCWGQNLGRPPQYAVTPTPRALRECCDRGWTRQRGRERLQGLEGVVYMAESQDQAPAPQNTAGNDPKPQEIGAGELAQREGICLPHG